MSFLSVCSNCGSPSGPSVGVCPFCKTVLVSKDLKDSDQSNTVSKVYASGNLPLALSLAKKVYTNEEAVRKNVKFLLLYAKILIDVEAPSSQIKSVLGDAFLISPDNKDILDYMELMELRSNLKKGTDFAEVQLKNLLRRSPENIHAYFILGTHVFWTDEEPIAAIPYLETCVRLAPNYLRAWGCLGAIYKRIGNAPLAQRAFQKCFDLEIDPAMKDLFQKELQSVKNTP